MLFLREYFEWLASPVELVCVAGELLWYLLRCTSLVPLYLGPVKLFCAYRPESPRHPRCLVLAKGTVESTCGVRATQSGAQCSYFESSGTFRLSLRVSAHDERLRQRVSQRQAWNATPL